MHVPSGRRAAVALLVTALAAGTAPAGTIRHDKNDLEYTNLAAASQYAAVGKVTQADMIGSGVLISKDWVLTAAHVVDGTGPMQFTLGGTAYDVAEYFPHPSWTGLEDGYDVGLIRLATRPTGVTPAVRYRGTAEVGMTGTSVGYGRTGTGLSGDTKDAGTKRAGQNVLDVLGSAVEYSDNILLADFDHPTNKNESSWGGQYAIALEYCCAPGDSGGGLFITVSGQHYLAGVTSFLLHGPYLHPDGNADADYGDLMGWVRVGPHNDWIDSHVPNYFKNAMVTAAFSPPGNWTSNVRPGAGHVAVFDMMGPRAITFSENITNRLLHVQQGQYTFALGGFTYEATGDPSLLVGDASGENAKLIASGGTLRTSHVCLGRQTGAAGALETASGAQWTCSGSVWVGGNATQRGGTGTMDIGAGTAGTVAETLKVWDVGGSGTVSVRGALDVATLDVSLGFPRSQVTLGVFSGGTLTTGQAYLARDAGSTGNAAIDAGGTWHAAGSLYIGGNDTQYAGGAACGYVNVKTGGTLLVDGGLRIWNLPADKYFTVDGAATVGNLYFGPGFQGSPPGTTVISISGAGTLTLTGPDSQWTGGRMMCLTPGTGRTVVAPGATLTIAGADRKYLLGRIVENQGTILWTGSGAGLIQPSGTSPINNLAGALFDVRWDATLAGDSTTPFNNAGTLRKSAGAGTAYFDVPLSNTGTVEVLSGTLRFQDPVAQHVGAALAGGTWVVGPGAALVFDTGSDITVNQGAVVLDGPGSTFAKMAGLADNQGAFTVRGGRDFSTPDAFSNTGTVTVGTGSALTLAGTLAELVGNTLTAGAWVVEDGATLQFPAGADVRTNQGGVALLGAASVFAAVANLADNQGDFRLAGGAAFTTVGPFANTGAVWLDGAALNVSGPVLPADDGVLPAGTWDFGPGSAFSVAEVRNIALNRADVRLRASGLEFPGLAMLQANEGGLLLDGPTTLVLPGDLANSGAIAVGPGSRLEVPGAYTQTAGSTVIDGAMDVGAGVVRVHGGSLSVRAGGSLTAGAGRVALDLADARADLPSTDGVARLDLARSELTLSQGAGGTLFLDGLTMDLDGSVIDLAQANLVIDYTGGASPLAAVAAALAAGLDLGGTYWGGPGIRSGDAGDDAVNLDRCTALGVIDNQDPQGKVGGLASLEGEPVPLESVLVKYTWWGDANLDGVVNTNDYDLIDRTWLLGPDAGGLRWAIGDFNMDGVLNTNDYDLIDRVWLLHRGEVLGAAVGGPVPLAATPEPATLALVLVGAATLALRHRA